jgi:hypothetical protein
MAAASRPPLRYDTGVSVGDPGLVYITNADAVALLQLRRNLLNAAVTLKRSVKDLANGRSIKIPTLTVCLAVAREAARDLDMPVSLHSVFRVHPGAMADGTHAAVPYMVAVVPPPTVYPTEDAGPEGAQMFATPDPRGKWTTLRMPVADADVLRGAVDAITRGAALTPTQQAAFDAAAAGTAPMTDMLVCDIVTEDPNSRVITAGAAHTLQGDNTVGPLLYTPRYELRVGSDTTVLTTRKAATEAALLTNVEEVLGATSGAYAKLMEAGLAAVRSKGDDRMATVMRHKAAEIKQQQAALHARQNMRMRAAVADAEAAARTDARSVAAVGAHLKPGRQ